MDVLAALLAAPANLVITLPAEDTLSDLQFANLTQEIDLIREKIKAGEPASLEEARKVVVWFRARRVKNFTLQKVKVVKEKAAPRERKPAVAKRQKASDIDALTLLADL
jgi:hypothetical protein